MHRKRSNRRSIWFIKTPNHQPQSFGDFAHGHYTAVVHQVNLLTPSPTTGARGLPPRFHTNWRRGAVRHARDPSFVHSQTRKHKLCLLPSTLTHLHVNPKGTTSLQSVATDDNGTPATWTLGLIFQQAIDRQDRTTD